MEKIIQSYTKAKVPDFFMYAKDKEKNQVEKPNDSVMNRIVKAIPNSNLKFTKTVSKFDYRMLMNLDVSIPPVMSDNPVVKAYDYWNARQREFNANSENIKGKDLYCFKRMRDKILEESGAEIDYAVNILVSFLYTVRGTTCKKKGLWECFGDVILENLKRNLEGKGKICPICGKRFVPKRITQNYCCDECYNSAKNQREKERFCHKE